MSKEASRAPEDTYLPTFSLCAGEVYLRGEPIFLQGWPEGDSQKEEGMSGVHNRLLKLATFSVRLGTINR